MPKPERDLTGYTTAELEELLRVTARRRTYDAIIRELDHRRRQPDQA